MRQLSGGCSCGAICYRLLASPMFTHACHCSLCQKLTGSAFIVNTMIEGRHFRLDSGRLKRFAGPSGSNQQHALYRCEACGDPIVSYYGGSERIAVVKVGTLDDPQALPPQAHVYVSSKLDWVVLSENVPQFEAFYSFSEAWPEESRERLKKL
ncbi:MAG: GFA family protein [bacterium]